MKESNNKNISLLGQALLFALVTITLCTGVLYCFDPESDYFTHLKDIVTLEANAGEISSQVNVPEVTVNELTEAPRPLPSTQQAEVPNEISIENDINKIPLEYSDQVFSASDILEDKLDFLPQDFKVPEGLKKRVGFWLDIYTKYSSHFSIIHDSREPWIIYKVVDLRPIYEGDANRFTKDANDHKAVHKARAEVRADLLRLSKKKAFNKLTPSEYEIYKLLAQRKGSRRKVFLEAARELRVQRGQKDFFRNGLISSSRYLNEMEDIFAKYDLPVELVRLPLVESSFNLEATSKVGASGIWQFMSGTGKKFLKVGRYFDERNSPIKATEAAAKLMLSNFQVTHSWPLAVTAYNHGAGGVIKACHKLHTTSIADLVNKFRSKSFSFASQNFYSEFLAALYGEKYQGKVFGIILKYPPLEAESIYLKRKIKTKALITAAGMTIEELKLYNPDLKAQAIGGVTFLPKGYHLRVPVGKKSRLDLFNEETQKTTLSAK